MKGLSMRNILLFTLLAIVFCVSGCSSSTKETSYSLKNTQTTEIMSNTETNDSEPATEEIYTITSYDELKNVLVDYIDIELENNKKIGYNDCVSYFEIYPQITTAINGITISPTLTIAIGDNGIEAAVQILFDFHELKTDMTNQKFDYALVNDIKIPSTHMMTIVPELRYLTFYSADGSEKYNSYYYQVRETILNSNSLNMSVGEYNWNFSQEDIQAFKDWLEVVDYFLDLEIQYSS